MTISPTLVWRSNLQAINNRLRENKATRKTATTVDELNHYIQTGGSLEECIRDLVEFFSLSVFRDTQPDEEGFPVEGDKTLSLFLLSDASHTPETAEVFDENVIRQILRAFQIRTSVVGRDSDLAEKKQRWRSILHSTYERFYHHRKYMYDTFIEFLSFISKTARKASGGLQFQAIPGAAVDNMAPDEKFIGGLYSVGDLLEVIGAIIQGLDVPVRKVHNERLLNVGLLPLHEICLGYGETGCALAIYHRQLTFCLAELSKKENKIAVQVLNRLCAFIPKMIRGGYSKPAVYLINECEELLEAVPRETFTRIKDSFFAMVLSAIDSLNYAVAQRSLLLLNTPLVRSLCLDVKEYSYQKIVPILLRIAESHWNDTTQQMAFRILESVAEVPGNPVSQNATFRDIKASYAERFSVEKEAEEKKQRRMLIPKKMSFDKLVFVCKLGEGSYSQVHHVRRIDSSVSQLYWEDYALKVMEEELLAEQGYMNNAWEEVRLLKEYFRSHPNIIRLISDFQDGGKLYLAMEFAHRGDLFSVLERLGTVDEKYAVFAMSQVCNAVKYMHFKKVCHLDIKPENILISQSGQMKLTDFGSAMELSTTPAPMKLQGTAEYLSPSLITHSIPSFGDDIWALGCLLYQLLAGTTPFNGATREEVFVKIKSRMLIFPSTFPAAAKDLVSQIFCLGKEKYEPMDLRDVMKHPFFDGVNWSDVNAGDIPTPQEGSIKSENIDMNLRQRKHSMLATQTLPSKYQFSSFALRPIPETPEESNQMED